MKKYIFDVDGTLTPSRGRIVESFRNWFIPFCIRNYVYLVTGSDYKKTQEQLGDPVLDCVHKVYNCSGSDVWQLGQRIHTFDWHAPKELLYTLNHLLEESKFGTRTGNHIEPRPGSLNFSVVGRNANSHERLSYVEWDQSTKEREIFTKRINELYPELHASIGGETGIDIYPKGKDKSQILRDFEDDVIYFFGDRMDIMGNDYPLGSKLKEPSKAFHVRNWEHTFELLKEIGD